VIPVWYLGFSLIGKTVDYGYGSTVFPRLIEPEYQIYSGVVILNLAHSNGKRKNL